MIPLDSSVIPIHHRSQCPKQRKLPLGILLFRALARGRAQNHMRSNEHPTGIPGVGCSVG